MSVTAGELEPVATRAAERVAERGQPVAARAAELDVALRLRDLLYRDQ